MTQDRFDISKNDIGDLMLMLDRQQADVVIDTAALADLVTSLPADIYAYVVFKNNPIDNSEVATKILPQFQVQLNADNLQAKNNTTAQQINSLLILNNLTLAELNEILNPVEESIPA